MTNGRGNLPEIQNHLLATFALSQVRESKPKGDVALEETKKNAWKARDGGTYEIDYQREGEKKGKSIIVADDVT